MIKMDLGQAVGIIANIGVIAGIVFLGFEVQQSNQLMRTEAMREFMDSRIAGIEITIQNPDLIELMQKNRSGLPLSPSESTTISLTDTRSFLNWQKAYFLFQEGILDEEYFRAYFRIMKGVFDMSGETINMKDLWASSWEDIAAPAFRVFIEQCVIDDCDSIPR